MRNNEDAQDLRREGKLLDARARLRSCAVVACPGPVREDCATRLAEIDRAIPTIRFDLKDDRGVDVLNANGYVDGEQISTPLDGTPLAVDPGEHIFRFETKGHPAIERHIALRESEGNRRETFVFASAPPVLSPVHAHSAHSSSGDRQRTIGLVVGGIGIATAAASSVLGFKAKSTYDEALRHCPTTHSCDPAGVHDGQSAHTQSAISTIGFVVSSALLASGAIIYFTSPTKNLQVDPLVGNSLGGVQMSGKW